MKTLIFVQFLMVWVLVHLLVLFISALYNGEWGWTVSFPVAAVVTALLLYVNRHGG